MSKTSKCFDIPVGSVLVFRQANQWHEIHGAGDIPSPRGGHTMAWSSAAGGLYVFGGSGRGGVAAKWKSKQDENSLFY